jgi:deazaflavin-dependent oxidoreductase (nitroreductase family)
VSGPAGRIPQDTVRFASHGRSWLIVLRGPRAMAFDRWLVRRTGFSLVSLQYALAGRYPYTPTLLLTTVGARTGELRRSALPYLEREDGSLVLVASKGGGPANPGWIANLRAHPQCWVHLARRERPAIARVVTGDDEWPELFAWTAARKASTARYQQRADTFGRRIPLVLLTLEPDA